MADTKKVLRDSVTGHRTGQAKPFCSDRGVFQVVLIAVVITLSVFLIGNVREYVRNVDYGAVRLANLPSIQPSVAICPDADEDIQFASGEKQKIVHVEQSCWSAWVVTPPTSDWRISPPLNQTTQALFIDGSRVTIRSGHSTYVGVRRGIFRLMGGGPVVATISFSR